MSSCRILLVSGSLRERSTNSALLRTAQAVAPANVEAILYEGLGSLPHFNPDDDPEGGPVHPAVADFYLARVLQQKGYDRAALAQYDVLLKKLQRPSLAIRTSPELAILAARPDGLYSDVGQLYGLARHLCATPSDAEDLVQETYARALGGVARLAQGSNLRAWLFRILRNCFIDQARRKKIVLEIADDTVADRSVHEVWDTAALDQLRYLAAADLERALATLSVELRFIVLLDAQGFSEAEKIALRFADLMYLDASQIDKAFYDEMKKHWSEAQIMELGSFITCHYATAELDAGPIIDQEVIRVEHFHTAEDLVRLGRDCERLALARSVRWHLSDRVLMHGNRTVVFRD